MVNMGGAAYQSDKRKRNCYNTSKHCGKHDVTTRKTKYFENLGAWKKTKKRLKKKKKKGKK